MSNFNEQWLIENGYTKQLDGSWGKPRRTTPPRDPGLRAVQPQPVEGRALDRRVPRKKARSVVSPRRTHIEFRIYSRRPLDSDNYSIKQLQDLLIHAGYLDGDEWHRLYHTVISEEVYTQAEEKTEVLITPYHDTPRTR